jgi:4-hydroxyphenylpyruvate dioxygenase
MNSRSSGNSLFINTILLGGTLEQKISAAHAAGFDQIELWRQDVESYSGDPESFRRWIESQGIGVTDYQIIRDFDGAPDDIRENKRAEALNILDTAVKIGASIVLTTASTDPRCVASRIDEDMRWLVREAAARQMKIAYENLAWSIVNFTLRAVWELVNRLNEPNLGVVIDDFHTFARGLDARDLEGIPMDRIFVVQLSDLNQGQLYHPDHPHYREQVIETARHHRLLPGHGQFPIETILRLLRAANYSGPIGVEVFNDDMKARDPETVAREAMAALRKIWLK